MSITLEYNVKLETRSLKT